jgi:hypothetical protein
MRIPGAAACAIGALASACSGADFSVASDGFATLGNEGDGSPGATSGTTGAVGPSGTSGPGADGGSPGTGEGESTAGCIPMPAEPCAAQAMGGIAAIGDDGNVPANAFDGDLATRWSFSGVGAWVSFDLGETRELCELRIAWYRGDERASDFRIEASIDGTDWTIVHFGASSGTSAAVESYALDGSLARWVRVVVLGNDQDDWASISEIETDARAPAVDDCDPVTTGGDDTGDAGEYDENGVLMLLPTDPECFSWSLVGDPNDDPHFRIDGKDGFSAEAQADGSWYFEPREGGLASGGTQLTLRLHVSGTDADEDFGDHAELRERGYMTSDPDAEIGNQEMTAYVRLEGITADDDTISKKIRGGRHSDGDAAKYAACVGLMLRYDGAGDELFEKELFHPDTPKFGVDKELDYGTAIADGAWIGDKITSVRQPDGSVVHTQYIDLDPFDAEGKPNNNWQKVFEYVDDGADVVNWTGKFSTWRIDEAQQVWVKYPSVRCVQGASP